MYPAPKHPDALMPPVTSLYTIRHNRGCWIGACELLRTPSARSSQNTPPPRSYKATPVVTGENGAAGEIVPEVAPPQILRIGHVEGGEMKPRITTLYKLAQGLEVDPAELVSE